MVELPTLCSHLWGSTKNENEDIKREREGRERGGGGQSWEGEGREEESREIARTSRDNAERLALKDGTGSAMASLSRRIMRMHRTSTQNIDLHIAVAFVGPSHVT